MIDLETLGLAMNSVVLSIGAVQFDENGLGKEFYCVVNTNSCADHGLSIDASTLAWWEEQNEGAREVLSQARRGGYALPTALEMLANAFDWSHALVWSNGLNFDIPILDTAYRACGWKTPWRYYNTRDQRTVEGLFDLSTVSKAEVAPAIPHHALEDAKAQALTVGTLLRLLHQQRAAALAA